MTLSIPDSEFIDMPLLCLATDSAFSVVTQFITHNLNTEQVWSRCMKHRVARRDLSWLNIMFDASPMYPIGFHAQKRRMDPTGIHFVKARRFAIRSLKYYIVDYDLSTRFEDSDTFRLVTGVDSQDRKVPELSPSTPYDPYWLTCLLSEISILNFFAEPPNLSFLVPLESAMTNCDPKIDPRRWKHRSFSTTQLKIYQDTNSGGSSVSRRLDNRRCHG
ncbi:hypothetical protein BD410DRAFT_873675 [Rickenella mellea]|uniref:Uncharacterized protein n=1 Tax=Rickenella mellea TaxID=50990 RepID=A0A4Y7PY64_9AGAM|nr:hypothetical protein BD410DRAFT_873675 [Rickenella mellea]